MFSEAMKAEVEAGYNVSKSGYKSCPRVCFLFVLFTVMPRVKFSISMTLFCCVGSDYGSGSGSRPSLQDTYLMSRRLRGRQAPMMLR